MKYGPIFLVVRDGDRLPERAGKLAGFERVMEEQIVAHPDEAGPFVCLTHRDHPEHDKQDDGCISQ